MITLEQYRKTLGRHADTLTDEEVQKRFDHMSYLADVMYGWWEQRKGTPRERITGLYTMDVPRVLGDVRKSMYSSGTKGAVVITPNGWETISLYENDRTKSTN